MPHSPEHVVEDPAVDPQQDRETLLETYKRNPLEGLGATAGMFMPNWVTGSRPETGLSLSDSLRGMIEFTPVVGDVMDLQEGLNFDNDMDPLERGLAFFAGAGVFGGAAATISMGAQAHMRNRYHQQAEEVYERLAATYRTPVVGMAPAAVSDRPTISMKDSEAILESVDQVRARLVEAQATTGIEQEKLAFTRGDIEAPRHLRVATARSTEQLVDALDLGMIRGVDGWSTDADGGLTFDMSTAMGGPRATFAAFLVELGTLMINTGLYESTGGQVTTHTGQIFSRALTDWAIDLDPDIFGAATHALAIYTQAKDAGLIHGDSMSRLSDKFDDGTLFDKAVDSGLGASDMASFISQLGDLAQIVMRHGGPDLTLTPNMKWNSFYSTPDGRLLGTMNIHVTQNSRYVDPENGVILDPEGLERQLWSMDYNTLVSHFVRSMLAIEDGTTSIAVSEVHRQKAKEWYPQFHRLIEVVAERYGLRKYQVGAIVSALSPRAAWDPDNVNWAILGALESRHGSLKSHTGENIPPGILEELNEVRVLAGFPPVDSFKSYGSALGTGQAKVSQILAGMNPVEALRMLKTMAFMHNGLFPEGTPENSAFGRAVITADTHAFRAITGFYHGAEAPWMKATMQVPKVNWLTGLPGWRSVIGEDLVARLDDLGEIDDDMALMGGSVPSGAAVPMFAAERMYDAIVRAHVIVGELTGISAVEAQARVWQPIMEASTSMRGNRTVVWHDGVLQELEGRSPTSPSITDSLALLDGALVDPMSGHLDMFTVADTHAFEPGVGILVASGPSGLRIYADPTVDGIVDQLRTARPIPARPQLFVGKKEGLTLESRSKPRATKLDPVRFVPRISRRADLAVVQEASLSTSPASEFRTVTDPSSRPGVPDVHSPGNYIVVEVAQGDTTAVRDVLNTNSFPLDVTEAPIAHTAGHHRSSAKLTEAEASTAFHRRASENPLNTQNWAVIPDDSRLVNRLKRNKFSPIPTYVRDGETGETRRVYLVFGLTAQSEFLANTGTFWTQDGHHADGMFTPVTTDGVSMKSGGDGTLFQVTGDPGSTDFSMEFAADEATPIAGGPRSAATATPTRRTQLIVELGSIPDPAMVLRLWENLDRAPSTVSLSGYFHGGLYADTTGGTTGHSMTQVGEYSFTNGNERMTQRAQHTEHLVEDENYYTVWVPTSEAQRLDLTHGTFPSKSTHHNATVERKSDNAVVLDGETTVIGAGENLEINTEKLLTSKVDGDPVRALAVTKDPTTGQPAILMAASEDALRASEFWPGFRLAAIFKVGARGAITGITNDALAIPSTMETTVGYPGPITQGEVMSPEVAAVGETALLAGQGGSGSPVTQERVKSEPTHIHDPKHAAEINDVFAAVELLLRYGATPGAIRRSLQNHPLGASIGGHISPTGPLLAHQRGLAGADISYRDWYDQKADLDKTVLEYYDTGDPTVLESWLIDASGRNSKMTGDQGSADAIVAKGRALDKDLQRVYKETAQILIGDYSLVEGLPVNILAGYRMPDQAVHHQLVMDVLGLIGALNERPGHIVPANAMRDLPGVSWFRERHGGVMFPGVVALLGSIQVGARNAQAVDRGNVQGSFIQPEYSSEVTGRGKHQMMDENGELVSGTGISVDISATQLQIDPEWHTRYLRLSYDTRMASHIAVQHAKMSEQVGDIGTAMTAIHEFGHAVHHAIIETGIGHVYREQLARVIARHGGVGEVRRQLGRYAATTWVETISESFDLVMVMGPDAPPMAIEIVDMAWDLLYQSDAGVAMIGDTPTVAEAGISHPWGGPTEIGFWDTAMSQWEREALTRQRLVTQTGAPSKTLIPPPKYEGGMLPWLEYLTKESGLGKSGRRRGKVVWSKEDLKALPDA